MDPIAVDDMEELDSDEEPDEGEQASANEYGVAIPEDPSMLHADGELHDLKDPDQVIDLIEQLKARRADLNRGELPKYEGRSTDWGGGGRSRLLYDQVRADIAQDYHEGSHSITWKGQHQKAMTVVKIVAIKHRARF